MNNFELKAELKKIMVLASASERRELALNFAVDNLNHVHYKVEPNDSDLCAIIFMPLEDEFGDQAAEFVECMAVEVARWYLAEYVSQESIEDWESLDFLNLKNLIAYSDFHFDFNCHDFLDRMPIREFGLDGERAMCIPYWAKSFIQFDAAAYIFFDLASGFEDASIRRKITKKGLDILSQRTVQYCRMFAEWEAALSDEERAARNFQERGKYFAMEEVRKTLHRLEVQHGTARKLKEEIIKKWLRIGESEFDENKTEFAKAQGLKFKVKTIVNDWLSPSNIALMKSKIDTISENDL